LHGFVPMKGVLANRHMKGFSPMPDMQTRWRGHPTLFLHVSKRRKYGRP
jgi:hypothetical protein